MALTTSQRLHRLNVRLAELNHWRAREVLPVTNWAFNNKPLTIGDAWPQTDGVQNFSAEAKLPSHWPLEHARLKLNLGGESLISISYKNGQTIKLGLDPYHQEFSLNAAEFSIQSDSVARLPFGEPVHQPRLEEAYILWLDDAVVELHLLLKQISESVDILAEHEVVPHLLDAAETALYSLDWPSDSQNYIARTASAPMQQKIWQLPALKTNPDGLNVAQRTSVTAATLTLTTTLKQLQKRFPPQGKIALTGHAHIDLAWLWPYDETRRKVRRTFHTALDMIKKSPDFIFNQSTAAYYAQLETDDPELLAAITEQVKAGRWEVLGGMWVEPDTNMPTGESLTRQILYGQRYFEKQFGTRHKVCWLPDCFGFSGALPQLLKQGGMESFFTIKVNWSENNQFPHDIFWWEGLDGSRVLAHTFDNPMEGYNGSVRPDCHVPTWQNFRGKTKHDETLLAVGYGDGGGGVTPEMLTREKQLRNFPALPTARWSHVSEFFERLHQGEPNTGYPAWQGEIYLELHRGTLTSQSHTKRLHRHAERALITAETLGSMAALMGGDRPNHIETLWHKVLKNEFHDILPGSSIKEVYEDAEAELSKVIEQGQQLQQSAIADLRNQLQSGEIKNALLIVNPSNTPRPVEASLANGQHYTTDAIVPALGYLVCDLDQKTGSDTLKISLKSLENNNLKVNIGKDGTIISLIHKPTGREALADRGNQLWVYPTDKPREWDAWEIEEDYAQNGHELTIVDSIEITEQSPHRVALQIVKKFRHSTITQTLSLNVTSKRLDIETKIDWHDRRVLLRVQNPVAIRAAQATFECAYGVVKRSTHNNTSWDEAQFEVPAHRFSDLSEPDFGVALLNNGKYGHSAKGNILGLSLVRAPIYPDPLADEGEQIFTYALYPHANQWYNGGVREEAEALNQPLLTLETSNLAAHSRSIVEINGVNAALSTLKPAEDDDGFVLRLYEPAGRRGTLKFTLPTGWQIGDALTIMEEASDQPKRQSLTPFEVGSWKIEKQ